MNSAECSLELVKCERVTSWPSGWLAVFIVSVVVGGIWVYRRSR
jgi:hypothetical protein